MGKRRFASTNNKPTIHYASDGITGHVRGWDVGVKVEAYVNRATGEDEFLIWTTGGSHDPLPKKVIGKVDSKGVFRPSRDSDPKL